MGRSSTPPRWPLAVGWPVHAIRQARRDSVSRRSGEHLNADRQVIVSSDSRGSGTEPPQRADLQVADARAPGNTGAPPDLQEMREHPRAFGSLEVQTFQESQQLFRLYDGRIADLRAIAQSAGFSRRRELPSSGRPRFPSCGHLRQNISAPALAPRVGRSLTRTFDPPGRR